jgi:hypothetical protein
METEIGESINKGQSQTLSQAIDAAVPSNQIPSNQQP